MVSAGLFGMNKWIFVFVFGMILVGLVSGGKVSVIILEDDILEARGFSVNSEDIEMEVTHEFFSVKGFAAEVDDKDLGKLQKKFGNVVVVRDKEFSVTLDVSVSQIGGNDSWALRSNGANITGAGQTVCIIDTGVNYTHAAFGGCYGNNNASSECKVIGGYDFVNGDTYPMDDEGHGTHVAGIVASSDLTYSGVAPNVKIIAMKAMDDNGNGDGGDIAAAIDWCVANSSRFNISVISMSLGDNSTYNTYCSGNYFESFIDAAVAKNISVVVSAGNCDGVGQTNCTIGVAVPACVKNATRVGAVNDLDVIDFMRGALFELMAPGSNIISSVIGGGFGSKSGTSMAAPHVAGSIALIRQYLVNSEQTKSVAEIDSILNASGIRLDDSVGSGYNFTRINVYDALLSLDIDSPDVSLVSPLNNNINLSLNQSFICNASDWQLANVTFRIWNSSEIYYNGTRDLSGTTNETNFNLIDLPKGEYVWNCFVEDVLGNFGSAADNFSLTIGEIVVDLNSPVNESYTNVNVTNFSCLARTDVAYELANISFRIWNSSGDLIRNESRNISGLENTTNFSYTFLEEDDYLWGCVALNNNSDVGDGVNFSIEYDVSLPVISDLSVDASTSSAVISWTTDEVSNSSVWMSGGTWSNSSEYATNHSISISGLSSSTGYTYVVRSCDKATNCVNSSGSFTTDAQSSSGGGGGGSSSGVKVIEVRPEEIFMGKSFLIGVNDKISFNLPSGSHSLTVSKVGKDYAEIVVMSEPLNLNLSVREEVKLNLSSSNYYDLAIRLNGISNRKANVSVMRIFEIIEVPEVLQKENDTSITPISPVVRDDEIQDFYFYKLLFVALVVISGGVILWVLKSNEEDRLARKNARIRERARRKMRKEKDEELKKELKRLGLKI